MNFVPAGPFDMDQNSSSPGEKRISIIFKGDDILVNQNGSPLILSENSISGSDDSEQKYGAFQAETEDPGLFIGHLDSLPCYALQADPADNEAKEFETEGKSWRLCRRMLSELSETEVKICLRGRHLLLWEKESRFCGSCGNPTEFHSRETARICPSCGDIKYPRISPAVITMVTKGEKILLAHNIRFPGDIYSVIAGFVDPGESLEETVVREIREEVGLEVKKVRYYGSQSWPFPNSLMCGFTAEWKSGEIEPDKVEIDKAGWFSRDALPAIPGKGSISRVLIDNFISKQF